MKLFAVLFLVGCATTIGADGARAQEQESGITGNVTVAYNDSAYATCAACHLADGAGLPGVFPRIRSRATTIASLEGGREYLITVVLFGLMGTIEVDGTQYFGVMAGNMGAMSPQEVADALNYLTLTLTDDKVATASVRPFTADEVEKVRSLVTATNPAGAAKLREQMLLQQADRWPK